MRVLCLCFLCLLLCGCLGAAKASQEPPPVQATIQIEEVRQADFTDKEPKKAFSWALTLCMAGSLFLVPVIMLKGSRF